MSLTPEQVKLVQGLLVRKGFMFAAPSESWTAQALEALKQYQISLGVQYPHCQFVPENFAALSSEVAALLSGKVEKQPEVQETVAAEIPPAETPQAVDTAIRIPKKKR